MRKFKRTYIEITNVCNLTCGYCPKTERKPQFMTQELFESILIKIKEHSEHLYFHVMGEPLLHPDIGLFIDVCHTHGYKVNLTTNGTFADKLADIISKPALRLINFSLHSYVANSGSIPENYFENIFSLIDKAKDEDRVLFSLRLWNLSDKNAPGKNKAVLQRIIDRFSPSLRIEECKDGLQIMKNVHLNMAEEFQWPDMNAEDFGDRGFCYGLKDQIAILADGTVVPCCLDREGDIKLGNISGQSLGEIISSERAAGIYNGFARRYVTERLCRRCAYRTRFNK